MQMVHPLQRLCSTSRWETALAQGIIEPAKAEMIAQALLLNERCNAVRAGSGVRRRSSRNESDIEVCRWWCDSERLCRGTKSLGTLTKVQGEGENDSSSITNRRKENSRGGGKT